MRYAKKRVFALCGNFEVKIGGSRVFKQIFRVWLVFSCFGRGLHQTVSTP